MTGAAGIGDGGGNTERGAGIEDGAAAAAIGGLLLGPPGFTEGPSSLLASVATGLRTAVCSKGSG